VKSAIGYLMSDKCPHEVWKLTKKLIKEYSNLIILSRQLSIDPFWSEDGYKGNLWEAGLIKRCDILFLDIGEEVIVIDLYDKVYSKISLEDI